MKSSELTAGPQVALLTRDLMTRARVAAALGPSVDQLQVLAGGELPEGLDLLLLDLNRDALERLAWLEHIGPRGHAAEVICFGPHTEMAELNPRARAAGAARCVANSHLPETLQRWLRSRRQAQAHT
ncbi:MAG: hypothetical protein ACLQNU_03875 [Candidatus Dormibacteria bacterium]